VNRETLNWWLTLLANLGVLGGLVFVGFEIRQNTSQLRADASYSITASVNELNAGLYGDPEFAEVVFRGEADLSSLTPLERTRFDMYEFSRLNIAEYVEDLEGEGVEELNFRYNEWIVREFQTKPGLRAFIREYEDLYVGSEDLLARLLGS
jgi:hypothetical protein